MPEWRNWTGDQRCVPARIERPQDRGDLIEAVKRATDQGLTVRAVGSGHSFTDAACTGGVLFEMDALDRVWTSSATRAWSRWRRASACER